MCALLLHIYCTHIKYLLSLLHYFEISIFVHVISDIKIYLMKIAVTNLKGGVGKTTIAVNLAVAFAQRGKSVCIIDTDQNQNSAVEWVTYRSPERPIIHVFPFELAQIRTNTITDLEKKFDIVILDGSPQLSELATRTIIVSDVIFIPVNTSLFDYKAFEKFLVLLKETDKNRVAVNMPSVKAYVILNKINERTTLSTEIIGGLQNFDVPVLKTKLANRTAYGETSLDGIGVTEGRDKKASDEFNRLVAEIENEIF
jgi:chromosome partitioning protein